jgi:phage major head subunit gpT-like protein
MIGKPLGLDVEGVKANFFSAYSEEGDQWQQITGPPITSNQETETYRWLDELNAFDYWDDKGAIPEAHANKWEYTLQNRPYGANWTVSDHEIRLDKMGMIMTRARQMGVGVSHWKNDRLASTIETASGNLFDGVSFFNDSHPTIPGSTYDNNLAGSLTQANLESHIATMRAYTGRSGKRLGVNPTHLIVPAELEFTARKLLVSTLEPETANNAINTMQNRLQLVVLDALTSATVWYLFDLSNPIKPIFAQELLPLRMMAQTPADKPDQFIKSRTYTFSADGEMAFGYSLPFLAAKVTPA